MDKNCTALIVFETYGILLLLLMIYVLLILPVNLMCSHIFVLDGKL